jgi:hypothetical protein
MSGSSVLKSLPPHVARELRRHISPKPLVSPFATKNMNDTAETTTTSRMSNTTNNNPHHHRMVFIGCTIFTAFAGCMPLILYYWVGSLNDSDQPLTAPQIRRGAFQNSGSKDIGKDPDWNFSNGTHKLRAGYGNDDTTNNNNDNKESNHDVNKTLPAEFLAMAPNDLKKVEDKIEAFAKGRGRNN